LCWGIWGVFVVIIAKTRKNRLFEAFPIRHRGHQRAKGPLLAFRVEFSWE
jgi:hypothetical protein